MGHEPLNIGHDIGIRQTNINGKSQNLDDFVLEKSIFANIFEKDIRRVFIYKKAERLAKAMHLVAPAFAESPSLRNRIDAIALGLVDAAVLPSGAARAALSRELLALSSVLSMARAGGLLSLMNVELIARETHALLQDVAVYEEPRLFLDEAPTLSGIAKKALSSGDVKNRGRPAKVQARPRAVSGNSAGAPQEHVKDTDVSDKRIKDRRDAILSVISNKGQASIKDISTLIRSVSEKTIQRELLALIEAGVVCKRGERRWSTYLLTRE
ncbi:hypothetical protein HY972_03410 [Candidatus Kaiserbacteria bacterium]|nr:hypothetical protein [Candidatus Kaiserbacteria bacterium]